jgi:hypothetical protein
MTGLLVGTFVIGGAHTLLWLPRAMQMRKELKEAAEAEERALEEQERATAAGPDGPSPAGGETNDGRETNTDRKPEGRG